MQRAPADQVNVQMKNRLPRARSHIQHGAVAIFNGPLPRDVRSSKMTAPDELRIFRRGFLQSWNMFFGDDQHVRWPLRIQIFKGKCVLVFIDFFRWYFATNDAAEQAVRHKSVSPRLELRSSGK